MFQLLRLDKSERERKSTEIEEGDEMIESKNKYQERKTSGAYRQVMLLSKY